MRIIVNTNRIIAALIKDSVSRKIIIHGNAEFIAIPFVEHEIAPHKQLIIDKAEITESEFDMLIQKLFTKMIQLDDTVILSRMKEASAIMYQIDPDDVPFIAAALATDAAIWSDDRHFQQQKKINVYTTHQLNQMLL